MAEIRLYIVCSDDLRSAHPPGRPTTTARTSDAYVKAFRPNDYVQFVQATQPRRSTRPNRRASTRCATWTAQARGFDDVRASWDDAAREIRPGPRAVVPDRPRLAPVVQLRPDRLAVPPRRLPAHRLDARPRLVDGHRRDRLRPHHDGVRRPDRASASTTSTSPAAGDPTRPSPARSRTTTGSPTTTRAPAPRATAREEQATRRLRSTPLRRHIAVDPPAYGDAAVRQRVYRRGGSLIDDWYFCGENDGDGGRLHRRARTTREIAAAGDPPDRSLPAGPDRRTTRRRHDPGPAAAGALGTGRGDALRLRRPAPPRARLLLAPPARPITGRPPATSKCARPREELMNGGIIGHQAFVFSRAAALLPLPEPLGLVGRHRRARALHARPARPLGVLPRARAGSSSSSPRTASSPPTAAPRSGSPKRSTRSSTAPPSTATSRSTRPSRPPLRLTVWENDLFFQYQDTGGARQVLVYSILQKFWRHYLFGQPPAVPPGRGRRRAAHRRARDRRELHARRHERRRGGHRLHASARARPPAGGARRSSSATSSSTPTRRHATLDAAGLPQRGDAHQHRRSRSPRGATGRQRFLVDAFGAEPAEGALDRLRAALVDRPARRRRSTSSATR